MVCHKEAAAVSCVDCGGAGHALLCGECDRVQHPFAHWHGRCSLVAGYKQPIAARCEVSASGELVQVDKWFASMQPCVCGAAEWSFGAATSYRSITAISLLGKQDFNMASGVCCSSCGNRRKHEASDLIYGGLWPLTADQPATYLDVRLIEAWSAWETTAPQLAAGAFLQGVNGLSSRFGSSGSLTEDGGQINGLP